MKLPDLLRIPPSKWTDDDIQAVKKTEADDIFRDTGETEDEQLVARLMRKGYVLGMGDVLERIKLSA